MRRISFGLILFILSVGVIVGAFVLFLPGEATRMKNVRGVVSAPSDIVLRLTITYDKPPIVSETWFMEDHNGVSTSSYTILGDNGKQVTLTLPPSKIYGVSFFFGRLVHDGIWKIRSQPPRGNTSIHYRLYVKQQIDNQEGSRTITFTDPHWWATTAGRQYQIHLSKTAPVPDLLTLQSTMLANPRYERIVADFRAFGSKQFRADIAAVKAQYTKKK